MPASVNFASVALVHHQTMSAAKSVEKIHKQCFLAIFGGPKCVLRMRLDCACRRTSGVNYRARDCTPNQKVTKRGWHSSSPSARTADTEQDPAVYSTWPVPVSVPVVLVLSTHPKLQVSHLAERARRIPACTYMPDMRHFNIIVHTHIQTGCLARWLIMISVC